MRNRHRRGVRRAPSLLAPLLAILLPATQAAPACAQVPSPPDSTAGTYPRYRWRLDVPLLAVGLGTFLATQSVSADVLVVPPEGLDPSTIRLTIDRNVLGKDDLNAGDVSDWTRNAALVYPFALSFGRGEGLRGSLRRVLIYVESLSIARGVTSLTQRAVSRPRPFTYLSDADRPADSNYDVTASRAFESMPSGHTTSAWAAVSFGITDQLLSRPHAGWVEHVFLGFAGGILASMTSGLRVEAGQHFPTDVMVGALIGTASGITVPLVHRDGRPLPSRRTWLETAAGTAVGIGVGLLLASAVGSS